MADLVLFLPRLILFGASEVACRLLGLGPPPKRKPEEIFGSKSELFFGDDLNVSSLTETYADDVLHALREEKLKGVRKDDIDALRSAFGANSASAREHVGHCKKS